MNQSYKWRTILSQHTWLPFVLPLAVFMLVGSFEPKPNSVSWVSIPYRAYPWVYAIKLIATTASILFVWPCLKPLLQKIGWKGIFVGAVGGFVWIWLCSLNLEQSTLRPLFKSWGLESLIGTGDRSAFNPFEQWKEQPFAAYAYLILRGLGLVLIVPVIEEHFLRGFVMRYSATEKWSEYPIGSVTAMSAVVGTLLPMLMHPGELVAAAVWFSMISLLAWYTRNIWECIAAHAVTNLVLGIYVVMYGAWWLV